jgi:hypothetical protein
MKSTYRICLTNDMNMKCFLCKFQGHLAKYCPFPPLTTEDNSMQTETSQTLKQASLPSYSGGTVDHHKSICSWLSTLGSIIYGNCYSIHYRRSSFLPVLGVSHQSLLVSGWSLLLSSRAISLANVLWTFSLWPFPGQPAFPGCHSVAELYVQKSVGFFDSIYG